MTPADDLRTGMYVAIVDARQDEQHSPFDFSIFGMMSNRQQCKATGQPLKILAISLPFVAVTDGSRRFAVDLREFGVRKLSRRYVEAFHDEREKPVKPFVRKRKKKEKPDPRACPRCGTRMIQQLVPQTGMWAMVCKDCGFNGGFVIERP